MSAYVFSAVTFLTVFGLITCTLWFVPSKLLAFLALDEVSFLAFGVLAGLVLGAIAGIQTWLRFTRAHANRVKFEMKREQLQEDYGRGNT